MAEVEEFRNIPALFRYLFLFLVSNIANSQTIIKSLPGFPGDLPFKLETGYVGVGERENLQLFYYFVESERNPNDDSVVIWLPGGPGCSSLRGFFYGIGPLTFNYAKSTGKITKLDLNPYSWTKVANVIFLDPPAAGFSYAKNPEAYKNGDSLSAKYTYEFLRKWLLSHPNFISNPLYFSGLSYSGVTVPILVQDIYNGNEDGAEPIINIQGYTIGNPLTDRNIDFNSRIPYAHQFALLSDELFESARLNCNDDYINVNPSNGLCQNNLQEVDKCLENIYALQILEPICNPVTTNPLRFPGLQEQWCREDNYAYCSIWTNDETVQKALHIRKGTITEWEQCNDEHYRLGRNDTATYTYDVSSSVVYHKNLTKKSCRALIYSGDHDMVFPYLGTRKWIRTLNLTVESTWAPWYVKNQVAGYMETFSHNDYSLTYATVKGAGHAVQEYKPEECLAMVDRWFGHIPL